MRWQPGGPGEGAGREEGRGSGWHAGVRGLTLTLSLTGGCACVDWDLIDGQRGGLWLDAFRAALEQAGVEAWGRPKAWGLARFLHTHSCE